MDNINDILANEANWESEEDYIGGDGLLYCGKCHTPKQFRWDPLFAKGSNIPGGITPVYCDCQKARNDLEKERERAAMKQFVEECQSGERRSACFTDNSYKSKTFAADKGKAPKAIEAARYYVDNFERFAAENKGLMFLGNVGTGKTFAACCIANELVKKGRSAWVITASGLIRAAGDFDTKEEVFSKLKNVDLLVLDDIGAQSNSDYNLGLMFDVVDERYKAGKPLVITSNLTVAYMKNAPNEKLARIYDRLIEMCSCPISPVILTGASLRGEIAKEKHGSGESGLQVFP